MINLSSKIRPSLLLLGLFFLLNNAVFAQLDDGPSATEMVDIIMGKSNRSVCRGLHFNLPYEEVKNAESGLELYEFSEPYYFTVSLDIYEDYLEFVDITYDFDEKGLYYISMEGYMATIERAGNLVDEFRHRFSQRFGKSNMAEDGFEVWQGLDKESNFYFEVAILNFSGFEDPGFILEFYALEERGPED
jgi:hypothetical protein